MAGMLFVALYLVRRFAASNVKCDSDHVHISQFMIWTTFGMDGTAIGESRRFHPYIGPALWTAYAFLSSTLLLSTMISILSVSFRSIAEDSTAEVMFKKVSIRDHAGSRLSCDLL